MSLTAGVMWHDVECGAYAADLGLWLELAAAAGGPVLDVGAGTGRVALRLAQAGHRVTALDRDGELLGVLAERAAADGLEIETVAGDAEALDVPAGRFGLVAVPMQTVQLLPGEGARRRFFAAARRALAPGGLMAAAIADALEAFDATAVLPEPDVGEDGGVRYVSQPLAVRPVGDGVRIERERRTVGPDGARTREEDVIVLARVDADGLAREAAAAGLRPQAPRRIAATPEHVGSTVVMARA